MTAPSEFWGETLTDAVRVLEAADRCGAKPCELGGWEVPLKGNLSTDEMVAHASTFPRIPKLVRERGGRS